MKTGKKPKSGYGTQARENDLANKFFKKNKIPLRIDWKLINQFESLNTFKKYLQDLQLKDLDILVCFDWGTLFNDPEPQGHVCVLDKIDLKNGQLRIIDPDYDAPKWRMINIDDLYTAMKVHGKDNGGGFWEIILTK